MKSFFKLLTCKSNFSPVHCTLLEIHVMVKHDAYFSLTEGDDDFNSSINAVKFDEGQSEVSSCITLYDDQLLEGDEVFSVFLNIPNVTNLEPGPHMLATVTIRGMYMSICMCMHIPYVLQSLCGI